MFYRLVYRSAMLSEDNDDLFKNAWSYSQKQVPVWQKWLLVAVLPVFKLFIRKKIGTESEQDKKWAEDVVESTIKEANTSYFLSHLITC